MIYIDAMTKPTKTHMLTFRVTCEDAVRIHAAAFKDDRSVADFVRRVVLAQLDKEKPNA